MSAELLEQEGLASSSRVWLCCHLWSCWLGV